MLGLDMQNPAVLILLAIGLYCVMAKPGMSLFNGNGNANANANVMARGGGANAIVLGGGNGSSPNFSPSTATSLSASSGSANGSNSMGANAAGAGNAVNLTNQEAEKLEIMRMQNSLGMTNSANTMTPLASNGLGNGNMVHINNVAANGMAGGLGNGNSIGVPSVSGEGGQLGPGDLLPQDSKMFAELQPNGQGPLDRSFLTSAFHAGVDTVGQSLRNANVGLRSEPANPQNVVSPWNNTTIGPDLTRRPLEGCE
jgi:hypothetical protein